MLTDTILQQKLRLAGMRPTQQRMLLGKKIWGGEGHRHISAEVLYHEARKDDAQVSLATVYNTLHQFTEAGLLKEIRADGNRSWFDTNLSQHHHFLNESTSELHDIPEAAMGVTCIPTPPAGTEVRGVEIIIRIMPLD